MRWHSKIEEKSQLIDIQWMGIEKWPNWNAKEKKRKERKNQNGYASGKAHLQGETRAHISYGHGGHPWTQLDLTDQTGTATGLVFGSTAVHVDTCLHIFCRITTLPVMLVLVFLFHIVVAGQLADPIGRTLAPVHPGELLDARPDVVLVRTESVVTVHHAGRRRASVDRLTNRCRSADASAATYHPPLRARIDEGVVARLRTHRVHRMRSARMRTARRHDQVQRSANGLLRQFLQRFRFQFDRKRWRRRRWRRRQVVIHVHPVDGRHRSSSNFSGFQFIVQRTTSKNHQRVKKYFNKSSMVSNNKRSDNSIILLQIKTQRVTTIWPARPTDKSTIW